MKKLILLIFICYSSIFANYNIFEHFNIQRPNLPLASETEHFKLYCTPADKLACEKVLDVAEKNFKQCSTDFNHTYSAKINLYVFSCLQDLHDAVGQPDAPDRVVNIYDPEKHSFFTVNPEHPGSYISTEGILNLNMHGITNLFIKDKYKKEIPFWFVHGIGLWRANYIDKKILNKLVQNHSLIPSLQQLEDFDASSDIYRACSYLMIEFINSQWGWDKILAILADCTSFEKTLEISKEKFEDLFIDYLGRGEIVNKDLNQTPFYFPKPTGQYAVGIKKYHWIDKARQEALSNDSAHSNRELMVNVWYPSSPKGFDVTGPSSLQKGYDGTSPSTPYAPNLVEHFKKNQTKEELAKLFYRPVYSYAQPEGAIATDVPQYSVIIFSHGSEVTPDHNTAQCENLAGNGYIVVGISHTYNSSVVKFPDGRIIDGLKTMQGRCKNKNLTEILQQFDQDEETWISDVRFVLDQLELLADDKSSIFYHRLDQKNIGIFGHSVGGGTAAQICRRDSRVKAGVSLDGFLLGPDATKKIDKPFMFMLAGDRAKTFARPWDSCDWKKFGISSLHDENLFKSYYLPATEKLARAIEHDIYTISIENAGHLDFCDFAIIQQVSPFWHSLMMCGVADGAFCTESIDGFRATEIVNDYLVNFFDKYLKGKPSDLLDGNDKKYAEVEIKQKDIR